MVINHYSQRSMDEQIHSYLKILDYIYESNKLEKERKERVAKEEADNDLCETIDR